MPPTSGVCTRDLQKLLQQVESSPRKGGNIAVKSLVMFGLVGAAIVAAFLTGRCAGPQYTAKDVADARRLGGDSATAAISARYVAELILPMIDTIKHYKAQAQAVAKIVIQRVPVHIVDTVAPESSDSVTRSAR